MSRIGDDLSQVARSTREAVAQGAGLLALEPAHYPAQILGNEGGPLTGCVSIHGNVPIDVYATGPWKPWVKVYLGGPRGEDAEWFDGPPVWGTDPYVRYFPANHLEIGIVIP